MTVVRLATEDDMPELAATLARAFAHDPFYSFLAGSAPERNQRMRDGWTGLLRHTSDGLSTTYTTDDRAGVAIWHPPGYRGASFIGSLRLLPSIARLAGGVGRLREVSRAVAELEKHRHLHATDVRALPHLAGRSPWRRARHARRGSRRQWQWTGSADPPR